MKIKGHVGAAYVGNTRGGSISKCMKSFVPTISQRRTKERMLKWLRDEHLVCSVSKCAKRKCRCSYHHSQWPPNPVILPVSKCLYTIDRQPNETGKETEYYFLFIKSPHRGEENFQLSAFHQKGWVSGEWARTVLQQIIGRLAFCSFADARSLNVKAQPICLVSGRVKLAI